MDSEDLRREITAQVQAEVDGQLRDLKRQKGVAEEELDNASERWRAERRRLNSEIDRLEDALSTSKRPSADNSGESQQAFDERLRTAAAEWEAERQRLTTQISRMESSIAESIARSNNPMRTTQVLRDQFDVRLSDANKMHLEAEREFLRTKTLWEEEKKKLMGELIRLRRLVPPGAFQVNYVADNKLTARGESVEETRIRELETQLSDARDSILKYHESSIRAAHDLASAKKEVMELNRALTEMREHVGSGSLDQLRREFDLKAQDLLHQNERLKQELESRRMSGSEGELPGLGPPEVRLVAGERGPIDIEVERVEGVIRAIESALDDPDTSASAIAQKNAEKAEILAYLRGLTFQLARARGL